MVFATIKEAVSTKTLAFVGGLAVTVVRFVNKTICSASEHICISEYHILLNRIELKVRIVRQN